MKMHDISIYISLFLNICFSQVLLNKDKVEHSTCSCTIGLSESCGHIIGLLYQLAHYKTMKYTLIPADVAKTSLPQTWHIPRGEKLHGDKVENITVQGYDRTNPKRATKGIKSTLYNPVTENDSLNVEALVAEMADTEILFKTVVVNDANNEHIQTNFGKVPKGCILSYQQSMSTDYIINLVENNSFPDLPIKNVMHNNVNIVLSELQSKKMESLTVSLQEAVEIEERTRHQSNDPKWHSIRRDRVTASHAGEIAKRRADGAKLAERLQSTRHVQTSAMKRGLDCENKAALAYSKKMNDNVNLFPCGVVVNPYCHWLASTPDRKVYKPGSNPSFGLLEIKCPVAEQLVDVKCLHHVNGELKLKPNDNYYYQIQMQMAVTGLDWCDFFIWLENESHLETVKFDQEFWQATKDKLDLFFMTYYLN